MRKARKKKEYAVYKGDKFLMIGDARQIARELGIKESSVYRNVSLQKKSTESTRYDDKIIIILIEEETNEI